MSKEVQIVIEGGDRSYSAYALDQEIAVIATGKTRDEVIGRMRDALRAWFDESGPESPAPGEIITVVV